jgi:hypothetical protein
MLMLMTCTGGGHAKSCWGRNIYVDGDPYLEGFLGFSLLPSQAAKGNARRYEDWVNWTLRTLCSRFTGSRLVIEISSNQGSVTIRPRDSSPDPKDVFSKLIPVQDRMCNAEVKTNEPKGCRYSRHALDRRRGRLSYFDSNWARQ